MDTEQQRIADAFNRFDWSHRGTLTSRNALPPAEFQLRFERWIRRLNATNQAKVNHLFVVEESPSGRPHIHFQLAGVVVPVKDIERLWISSGGGVINEIMIYDPAKGSGYTVKDWLTTEYHGADLRGLAPLQKEATP